nr:immunoglobulin light chain junction region [Macaca mulatta]MPO00444.1 immunoglobulin light chain junction region [Macaca mulatta]
CQHYDSSPSSF